MKALVLPNHTSPAAIDCLRQLLPVLEQAGVGVLLEPACSRFFETVPAGARFDSLENGARACDVIITVGGDGTILYHLALAVAHNKPILGVNTGLAGFICSLEPQELPLLGRLAAGTYSVEERMLLQVSLEGPGSSAGRFPRLALNDAVICNNAGAYVASLSVSCDGRLLGDYLGDGLIFATPTGSTAYNLSAGGVACEPILSLIAMTPICPHSLLQRPLIFSPQARLRVQRSTLKRSGEIVLVVDGGEGVALREGDAVVIERAAQPARFVRFGQRTFFENLRAKLSR